MQESTNAQGNADLSQRIPALQQEELPSHEQKPLEQKR
jgi:hypothetical protein